MEQFPAWQGTVHHLCVSQLTVNKDEHVTWFIREKAHHICRCTIKAINIPETHNKPICVDALLGGAALVLLWLGEKGEDSAGSGTVEACGLACGIAEKHCLSQCKFAGGE